MTRNTEIRAIALSAARLLAEVHNYCLSHPHLPRMPRHPEQNAAVHPNAWDIVDSMITCWFENENRRAITMRTVRRRERRNKPSTVAFSLNSSLYEHMERSDPGFSTRAWTPDFVENALAVSFEEIARQQSRAAA